MEKFAGYGFNKSHSAAYAMVTYQTAYLKTHYPAEFMAAQLSCEAGNTDKITLYISECRNMEIEVVPPHVNQSFHNFSSLLNVFSDLIIENLKLLCQLFFSEINTSGLFSALSVHDSLFFSTPDFHLLSQSMVCRFLSVVCFFGIY